MEGGVILRLWSEGSERQEVILYRDARLAFCRAVWDELNWNEVRYKCQHTMSMRTRRNVSHCACRTFSKWAAKRVQDGESGCLLHTIVCICLCLCASFKTERARSYSVGGIVIEYCFLCSEVPWKAVVTMWDGNYISEGQQEKSWPSFSVQLGDRKSVQCQEVT